jgi:hypothetical protein
VTVNFCRQGCYLLSTFCKRASWEEFLAALAFTHYHWHEATMGPRFPLNVFNHAKESYDIDLSTPDVGVTVAEMGSWDQDDAIQAKEEERKKALHIAFKRMEGEEVLVASFVMEKKERISESLKDLAAEAVAKHMVDKSLVEIVDPVGEHQGPAGEVIRQHQVSRVGPWPPASHRGGQEAAAGGSGAGGPAAGGHGLRLAREPPRPYEEGRGQRGEPVNSEHC